ncbi:MAG: HicB family protein [Acidimicrobiales bacterium]|nr:MAG: HicB family protein [Acidimicrobiales bacterium]
MSTHTYTVVVQREDDQYVALALEVDVASQGDTPEDALANLREALELYLEDNQTSALPHPWITSLDVAAA